MNNEHGIYSSIAAVEAARSRSFRIWGATFALVSLWTISIIAAPVARSGAMPSLTEPLFIFFGYICHQLPERSLSVFGEPLGVCSRCFGIYLGLLLGIAVYPVWQRMETIEPLPRFWLFISLIPVGVDWSLTAFGIWENTHFSRLVTGVILGFACGTFILPALIEVAGNLARRSKAASL